MSIDIEALAKRVEENHCSSVGLNCEIARATGWQHVYIDDPITGREKVWQKDEIQRSTMPPNFTGSLDAAMTLVPKGWWLEIKTGTQVHAPSFEWPVVAIGRQTSNRVIWQGQAKSIPLTITAAALRARAAKDKA